MSIYEKKNLMEQSFFQKLFKKQPKQNFIIELENTLFENEDKLLTLDISTINSLKQKYNIKSKDFTYEREFLLNRFISHCLWDEHLSDEEKKQLSYYLSNAVSVLSVYRLSSIFWCKYYVVLTHPFCMTQ